jgi:hypothetical protein
MVALAQLADDAERESFRTALDAGQRRLFDQQIPVALAALLDDLAGRRDEAGALTAEVEGVATLNPAAHPLALYGSLEIAHNRRRAESERTQFAGRTVEKRAAARAWPDSQPPVPADFAARAQALGPLLPDELQRIFEATLLLGGE